MAPAKDNSHGLEADAAEVARLLAGGALLFDLRSSAERVSGGISGAQPYPPDKLPLDRTCILYCASGARSLAEAERLRAGGYPLVLSLRGGLKAWQQQGLDWQQPGGLGPQGAERYARQMVLPQLGLQGQQRLRSARVLLIGGGGLGAPVALYLAAAGIGTLGMVDDDRVERSNLHRQVLYTEDDLGQLKTAVAERRLKALSPGLEFKGYSVRLNDDTVAEVFTDWDLVIDGSDNFPTRYLVNDACLVRGWPLVSGAATAFEGQLGLFHASLDGQPCYRCLYPHEPSAGDGQPRDCNSVGVLGTVPGLVAMLQATEAIKYLAKTGRPLLGRLLLVDALNTGFRELAIAPRPGCVCSPAPTAPRR
jgi:molybdopterin/thiamine biosynthesis adenylyltransferase/rhodanese-related sulfurtransferase